MKLARIFVALTAALFMSLISADGAGQVNPAHAQTISDRDALVALYNATDGDNWTNKRNWLSDKPIDRWYGVWTDADGKVFVLDLFNNQLTGQIPPELGSLTGLRTLSLSTNQLTGQIPPELGILSSLTRLYLGGNQLSGEIPPELGKLSNLTELNLSGNQLSGEIPAELGSLTNLTALNLSGNQLSGEIPPELVGLTNLTALYLGGNQSTLCLSEALNVLRRRVRETDVDSLPDCMRGVPEVVLAANDDPLIYNDNVFVLPVAEDFAAGPPPLRNYAARFYKYFRDDFDFLIFVLNVHSFNYGFGDQYGYLGVYHHVKNDVRGIGDNYYSNNSEWGSAGGLQGAIEILKAYEIFSTLLLHEIVHRWANHIMPSMDEFIGRHWGFSSANGLLGGFDIADFVDHGGGRYSAGKFSEVTATDDDPKPYSLIELYLAGLIPPEEVPDLWVAEDGKWLDESAADGDRLFAASKVRTYTIEDIIRQHGRRVPGPSQSQKDFRAAVILLVDEDRPLYYWQLDLVSRDITLFNHAGADRLDKYNFYEATGGRATITMDGLSQSLNASGPARLPGVPAGLTATENVLFGIELSWSEPASDGGLGVTAYDLRHIETSADETAASNWTVVEDVWTIGGGALQHTPSGLTAGTQYDFQVRAVNGRGAGPWSATAVGTPSQPSDCIPAELRTAQNNDLDELGLPFCDVVLSGLAVSPGSLAPAFDPYRTEYSASVGLSPVTVTVTPTNDHNATFQFLDNIDVVLADADNSLAGFQVEFGGRVPAVKIKVVSMDTQAAHTYVVTDLGNRYDTDGDRVIQRDEALAAVADYFRNRITREEVLEVVNLYFSG